MHLVWRMSYLYVHMRASMYTHTLNSTCDPKVEWSRHNPILLMRPESPAWFLLPHPIVTCQHLLDPFLIPPGLSPPLEWAASMRPWPENPRANPYFWNEWANRVSQRIVVQVQSLEHRVFINVHLYKRQLCLSGWWASACAPTLSPPLPRTQCCVMSWLFSASFRHADNLSSLAPHPPPANHCGSSFCFVVYFAVPIPLCITQTFIKPSWALSTKKVPFCSSSLGISQLLFLSCHIVSWLIDF